MEKEEEYIKYAKAILKKIKAELHTTEFIETERDIVFEKNVKDLKSTQ